jgi:hypothetical protein
LRSESPTADDYTQVKIHQSYRRNICYLTFVIRPSLSSLRDCHKLSHYDIYIPQALVSRRRGGPRRLPGRGPGGSTARPQGAPPRGLPGGRTWAARPPALRQDPRSCRGQLPGRGTWLASAAAAFPEHTRPPPPPKSRAAAASPLEIFAAAGRPVVFPPAAGGAGPSDRRVAEGF